VRSVPYTGHMRAGRIAGFLLLACLAGCGQKGPLYPPGHAPKSQIPKAPAAHPAGTPPAPVPPAVTPSPAQPTSDSGSNLPATPQP
jgi:Prokaryotic lipoprotein-attachment site